MRIIASSVTRCRMAGAGLLSLLAHGFLLLGPDLHVAALPFVAADAPLSVRLASPAPPSAQPAVAPSAALAQPSPPPAARRARTAKPAAQAQPGREPVALEPGAAEKAAGMPAGAMQRPPHASLIPVPVGGAADSAPPTGMPGAYRTAPPPPATLDYTLSIATPDGAVTGGSARIDWDGDGNRYRLDISGVLGEARSEGTIDDGGVAPIQASQGSGPAATGTRFDRATGTIVSELDQRSYPLAVGSQDRASLLLQLASMGLADRDQLENIVEFWVADTAGVRIERYQVAGPERIDTGIGALDAVRLDRMPGAGSSQLTLWLSPQHAWLPVQLRVTDADGTVRNQTLSAIALAPRPGH